MEPSPRIIVVNIGALQINFWKRTSFNSTLTFFDVLGTPLHECLCGTSDCKAQCCWYNTQHEQWPQRPLLESNERLQRGAPHWRKLLLIKVGKKQSSVNMMSKRPIKMIKCYQSQVSHATGDARYLHLLTETGGEQKSAKSPANDASENIVE